MTAYTSRWGEFPLPHDHGYIPIPGWVSRNLRYFTNRVMVRDEVTGDVREHPDFGKQVGITRCERSLIYHIMAHKFDYANSQAQVALNDIAHVLGVSRREIQYLRANLVRKGALRVISVEGKPNVYDFSELINQCKEYEILNTAAEQLDYGNPNKHKNRRIKTARKLLDSASDNESESQMTTNNGTEMQGGEDSCVYHYGKELEICTITEVIVESPGGASGNFSEILNSGSGESGSNAVNGEFSADQNSVKDAPPSPPTDPFARRPRENVIIAGATLKQIEKKKKRAAPDTRTKNQTRLVEWADAIVGYFLDEKFTGKPDDWSNPMFGPHIRAARAFLMAENKYWSLDSDIEADYDLARQPKELLLKMISWMTDVRRWKIDGIGSAGLVRHLGEFAKYWQDCIARRTRSIREMQQMKADLAKPKPKSVPRHSDGSPRYLVLNEGDSAEIMREEAFEDGTIRRIYMVTRVGAGKKMFNEVIYPGETDPRTGMVVERIRAN